MTLEEIRRLEYLGGGYFRIPGPVGKKMPIIHAPELLALLLKKIAELESGA